MRPGTSEESRPVTLPAPQSRLPGERRSVVSSVVLSVGVVSLAVLPAFLTGALAVEMREDFELAPSTLGLLVGLFFGCAALSSGPAGQLVERIGATAGMRLATLGAAVSMAGIAALSHSGAMVAGMLVVGGLANGLAHPAANLMLVGTTPLRRRGLVLGIKQAAIPTATLVAGVSLPLVALTVGWRWAFATGAAAALVVALVGRSPADRDRSGRPSKRDVQRIPRGAVATLVVLAAGATLGIWGGQAMGAFLVSYGVDRGFDKGTAGLILTLGSLAGIASRIIAGYVVDRRASSGLPELRGMLAIGAIGLLALATGVPVLLWLGPIAGFAGGWGWTGVLNYAVVRAYPMAPAAATGIIQSGVFLGATLGVPLFGLIVESASYSVAWSVTAVGALVAGTAMWVLGRSSWRQDQTSVAEA
jgi:MFS family permease